jgi:hypothetical protein
MTLRASLRLAAASRSSSVGSGPACRPLIARARPAGSSIHDIRSTGGSSLGGGFAPAQAAGAVDEILQKITIKAIFPANH